MLHVFDVISDAEISLKSRRDPISRVGHGIVAAMITKVMVPFYDPLVRKKVHGTEILLPISHALPRYVAQYPYYDTVLPEFTRFLVSERASPRKLVLVDVGANIGDTAKLVSAAAGSDELTIICIEADGSYFPLLRQNTEGLDVSLHQVIAAATTREVNAAMDRSGKGTSSITSGEERHAAIALDDLLAGKTVDIIKIDTDGYEAEVLAGLPKTLERCAPALFIEFSPTHLIDYGKVRPAAVLEAIRRAGYSHGIIYDHLGYPMALSELTDSTIANLINYCRAKPGFYVDILTTDLATLSRFYERDLQRYQTAE